MEHQLASLAALVRRKDSEINALKTTVDTQLQERNGLLSEVARLHQQHAEHQEHAEQQRATSRFAPQADCPPESTCSLARVSRVHSFQRGSGGSGSVTMRSEARPSYVDCAPAHASASQTLCGICEDPGVSSGMAQRRHTLGSFAGGRGGGFCTGLREDSACGYEGPTGERSLGQKKVGKSRDSSPTPSLRSCPGGLARIVARRGNRRGYRTGLWI